nr:uncharacterized protein LOC109619082 [Crassostrea gigas]
MDSWAVMRGSKNGLEKKIRESKAPALLDIDGDICHRLHNASKKLCAPFDYWVESLFTDLHTDHRWSVDLREKLAEVCEILGIKFTTPERFVSHRWTTCYDIAAGTLRLWDAYYVFYFGFLKLEDRKIYKPVIRKILNDRKVSEPARAKLDSVHNYLKKKSMTSDGKMRKTRIFEKVLFQEKRTILVLHFYTSVFPILKEYVMMFQTKQPMVHRLYDKQLELFKVFITYFLKPEAFTRRSGKQMKAVEIEEKFFSPKKICFWVEKQES